MPHVHVRSLLPRVLLPALVASLFPLGTAFAQSPHVRVIEELEIASTQYAKGELLMRAPAGTVLEVIHIDGDRYTHREANWYWVLLPRDPWGTSPAGWVSGRKVEYIPPVEAVRSAPAPAAGLSQIQRPPQVRTDLSRVPGPVAVEAPVPPAPVNAPLVSEVILHFSFGKSDLSDDAKGRLATAVAALKANAQGVSVALEGHADWTGSEAFNEKLGLARAETVRRYLADQLQVPADTISVISYGEKNPAASNATAEGRAQNRRVVIKVGA
jgi:outer membrane protein OmpA-like peptidoglycan-associated protein